MKLSTHARERMISRAIPDGIVDLILTYGEPAFTKDGALRIALSKRGLKNFRREYGAAFAKTLEPFRRAYVVVAEDTIVTAAFAKSPLHR